MFHSFHWIKFYESSTSFTNNIKEAIHITQIKIFFNQTNMKKSYKKKVLDHNIEKFSLMVRSNLNIFVFAETITQVNQNAQLQVISVSGTKKIMKNRSSILKKMNIRGGNIVA